MKTAAVSIAVVLGMMATTWAMNDDFSPFPPGKKPRPYAIHECKNYGPKTSDNEDSEFDFAISRHSYPRISIQFDAKEQGSIVALKDKDGRTLAKATSWTYSGITSVYAVDLNGDKIPDFVTLIWSNGCGLAAEIYSATFFLSDGKGYVARTMTCYDPMPGDFIDFNKDGRPEFVHTMFVGGEKGKDGREHNYYVYNILRFEGTDIISGNDLDPRFPAWIYYKFKPNHDNTDQLTAEQRMRLWRNTWSATLWSFPHFEALEHEQARTVPRAPATQPGKPKAKSKGKS